MDDGEFGLVLLGAPGAGRNATGKNGRDAV